ncbi:MAG: amidophosphoribosyltransferase [candidate division WOR-3 bacterium]
MCGIFGISSPPDKLADLISEGLFALQHRGQEAAGMAIHDGNDIRVHKGVGLVPQVMFQNPLRDTVGTAAIGHTRYSTHGASALANAQPFVAVHRGTRYAIAHNGNLSNANELVARLEEKGMIFSTDSDTEALFKLYVTEEGDPINRLNSIARSLTGAYSLLLLHDNSLIAVRDPHGFRPLWVGKLGDAFVLSSEDSAFNLVGAEPIREMARGEIVVFREGKQIASGRIEITLPEAQCVFELIYFGRPDSRIFGHSAYAFRKACGKALALREDMEIDLVSPVPDSGLPAALGFSEASGKPLEMALIRNHYVGRSFIQPTVTSRRDVVRNKLLPLRGVLEGASIALVDDSIVRGTTSRLIVELLRDFGAREVHLRIASPPLTHPCFFGIDMPTKEELLASSRSIEEIREFLGADSVRYLDISDLRTILAEEADRFCYACFTGKYPDYSLPSKEPYRRIRK